MRELEEKLSGLFEHLECKFDENENQLSSARKSDSGPSSNNDDEEEEAEDPPEEPAEEISEDEADEKIPLVQSEAADAPAQIIEVEEEEKSSEEESEGTGDSGEKTFQDIAEQNCRKEIFSTELQDGSVKEEGDTGVKKSCFESFGLRKFSFSSSVSEPDGESPKIKRQATVGQDGIIEPTVLKLQV